MAGHYVFCGIPSGEGTVVQTIDVCTNSETAHAVFNYTAYPLRDGNEGTLEEAGAKYGPGLYREFEVFPIEGEETRKRWVEISRWVEDFRPTGV